MSDFSYVKRVMIIGAPLARAFVSEQTTIECVSRTTIEVSQVKVAKMMMEK